MNQRTRTSEGMHDILSSIANMTENNDVDSLEYSLLATLAEMLGCESLSLYKLINSDDLDSLEATIELQINTQKKQDEQPSDIESVPLHGFHWQQAPNMAPPGKHIHEVLTTGVQQELTEDQGRTTLVLPIQLQQQCIAVLEITGIRKVSRCRALIHGLIKIYQNYLNILNESEKDKLTSLFNRRTFDKKLSRLLQRQTQQNVQAASDNDDRRQIEGHNTAWLAMIDIDHFKNVNDEFGHICGDEVLLLLSQLMRKNFRASDLLFRFGGEEFVLIMEPTSAQNAEDILQRFRENTALHRFPLIGNMTISMGYTRITEDDYPETILDLADKALYYAKENGRNRAECYEDLVAAGLLAAASTGGDEIELF